MGEIAESMLDGTLCEGCGVYLGSDMGIPMRCAGCRKGASQPAPYERVQCSLCGKWMKFCGLRDHTRDVHQKAKS